MAHPDPDLPNIPGYAVEAALGSGGMATVYRARQLALDRPVAIKVVRAYGRESEELNQRFEQEAKLIAALDHPNIVAIYEVTRTSAGDACYVMPLLADGDLACRAKPMAQNEIQRVIKAVLAALGFAHTKGVVHRDVKPANVLFDARDTPLLADFGVALKVENTQRLTAHGRTVGSSHTMSPEQARGEVVDGRSDLYSVGCLAFELLLGWPPFDGDDFLIVALKHQQEPIPRLPERLAHWQPFFDRALAKRPEDRYADADAMAAALAQIGLSPSRTTSPPRRSARLPTLLAAGVLLVLALGWFWANRAENPTAPGVVTAVSPLAAVSAAMEQQRWFDGSAQSADALLGPLFASEPVDMAALNLRDSLLERSSAAMIAADDGSLAQRLPLWSAFVKATHGANLPPAQNVTTALQTRLRPALERARTARDRAEASTQLALAQALLPVADAEFAELTQLIAGFPARGEPFRDGEGPELLLIPGGRLAGFNTPFAVTRFEISRAEYMRFADATQRALATCRDAGRAWSWRDPGFEQSGADPVVCVSHNDALAYAAWLTQQSRRTYRLLTRAEWLALSAAARVDSCGNLRGENDGCHDSYRATAPGGRFASAEAMPSDFLGNVREWTADCEYKTVNAAKRLGTTIGNWFREADRDTSGKVCVGRFVVGSGWRDSASDGSATVADPNSAAIDRGFRLIREIR